MSYKWKPSKTQRREFAQKMQNPEYSANYYARKEAKAEKRRSNSRFDYNSAGGQYVPTLVQYNFALSYCGTSTPQINEAINEVIYGYTCNEKIHHDHIHIVNDLIRKQP